MIFLLFALYRIAASWFFGQRAIYNDLQDARQIVTAYFGNHPKDVMQLEFCNK
jgi:hypothetical protein